jgi:predicted 3-demethylubiquinone-9 3-methyltransferase (glyoxalase superfamily)
MQKITPFLWFDSNAEEALNFYAEVFRDASIGTVSRYPEGSPAPAGSFMVGTITLHGLEIMALNAGPHYKLNPAFSLMVRCEDQAEIDYFWERLGEGGEYMQCGWLTDRFGVSWQITPAVMDQLLMGDGSSPSRERVMHAMMQMVKLDIATLKAAAAAPD